MGGGASTQAATANSATSGASKSIPDTVKLTSSTKPGNSVKTKEEAQPKEERIKNTPLIVELPSTSGEKALSNNKLKKLALGIQGYKDQQRDYDATLAQLDLNRTSQVDWTDPKSDPPFTPNKPLENKFSSPQLINPNHSASIILSPADKRKLKELSSPELSSASSSFYNGPRGNSSSYGHLPPGAIPVRPFPKDRIRINHEANNEDKNTNEQQNYLLPPMNSAHSSPFPHHNNHPQSTHVLMSGHPVPTAPTYSPMIAMNHHPMQSMQAPISAGCNIPSANSNKLSVHPQGPGQLPPRMVMVSGVQQPVMSMVVVPANPAFARPPPTSAPVPVVKETKNVKRNKIQLPTTYSHAKPTTGDWLNKRYIVNNYILLDTLGSGSYGEVRLCKDRVSDKLYAIKIISKDFLKKKKGGKNSETYFEDIKREIAIMKKLLHPNILRLHEVLDDPKVNKMYLLLEYMKRGDLVNVLKKRTEEEKKAQDLAGNNNNDDITSQFSPLSDFDLWHIFRQIVSGIRYLHFQNIVHGDIKPQNLLLGEEGIVKVADFGISQMLSGSGEKLADAGGTPAFMAPELCENKSFSGQLADIWAIGATTYMLKFGHPPFIAKNIVNLYYKICNDPLVFPFAIDPGLRNLLEGLLEKDPEKRMSMIQIVAHPWFRFPPSPIPKIPAPIPTKAINTTFNQQNQKGDEKQSSRGLGSRSDDSKAPADGLSFQPPPTYDAEEEAAMKGPIHFASINEVYMSIGGIRQPSDPNVINMENLNMENAIQDIDEDYEEDDDDEEDNENENLVDSDEDEKGKKNYNQKLKMSKKPKYDLRRNKEEAGAKETAPELNIPSREEEKILPPGQNRGLRSEEEKVENSEISENLMQTNWGNDVFQIVDVNDDDDEVDDVDDDSADEGEKKDKLAMPRKSDESGTISPNLTRHNEMTVEEENRRSKQFLKKNTKRSQQDVKASNNDSSRSSRGSNTSQPLLQVASPISSSQHRMNVKESASSSPGTSSSNAPTPSQSLHKRFFPPVKEPSEKFSSVRDHSRVSLFSNNDLDEEPEQLSNEEFQKLMDTLSQQPSKATSLMHKSYDLDDYKDDDDESENVLYEEEERENVGKSGPSRHSLDFLIAPLANQKNEIGCACFSEQGQRPTQEDRFIVQINLLQYFTHHNLLSSVYEAIPNIRDQLSQISVVGIFDGHSGTKASQYLAHHFLKRLIENEKCLEAKYIESVISETFFLLDYEIIQILKSEEDTCGSTGVVVWYDGRKNMLTVAGVGDSLCVLSRNGRAIVMNKMHRLDIVAEKERVRINGGTVINSRVNGVLAVSRAFGDIQFKSIGNNLNDNLPSPHRIIDSTTSTLTRVEKIEKAKQIERESLITAEPDIRSEIITPKTEFALVASDGLWDVIAPQVAVRFIRDRLMEHKDMQKAVKELTIEALANHSVDNITIILVTFHTSFTAIKS